MSKELVLSTIEELGFSVKCDDFGYVFEYEKVFVLYLPDEDDENFLRFALPNIYDITEENKPFVLEVVNETNIALKYSKTCAYDDCVCVYYEHRLFGGEHMEDVIRHILLVLQATAFLFLRKIEGDDTLPGADDFDENNTNNNETKEEE